MTRFTVASAAAETQFSVSTIRRAIVSDDLHATQRLSEGQPMKGSRWKIQGECLNAWTIGELCPHRQNVTPIQTARKRIS